MAKKLDSVSCELDLKREGKHVSHFFSEADGVFAAKDIYMPNETFNQLGKPQKIKVTIEVAK